MISDNAPQNMNRNKTNNSFTTLHMQSYMRSSREETINAFCILWKMCFLNNKTSLKFYLVLEMET